MRIVYAEDVRDNVMDMDNRGLLTDLLDVEEAIDEAPSVDAIPIEWLEGFQHGCLLTKEPALLVLADAVKMIINSYKEYQNESNISDYDGA